MAHWLNALQRGALPDPAHDWGDPGATQALRPLLHELDLTQLTQGSEAMARQVMQSVLWHLDSLIDRPEGEPRDQAVARMRDAFRESWDVQRHGWDEVLALMQSLGDLAHLRWDELKGVLSRREWAEARRIGELLARLPRLAGFIDGVGRRQPAPKAAHAEQASPQPQARRRAARHPAEEPQRRPEPQAVDGVHRSRALARMTGADSALLMHPVGRRLWRARFAEAQLMTYDDRAPQTRERPDPSPTPAAIHRAPLGRGPMIVCLDTSGSMRGAPENVAKACVLQALRSAHAGQRPCTLVAFGGAGEVVERELAMDAQGLNHLLDCMGQAFDGGTDVQTPLEHAVARVQQTGWTDADVLIVSDGEFGVTHDTLATLRDAKSRLGLRVHGILIGDRETVGLVEVCDALHWVRDWRRWGSGPTRVADDFSPVHSRSLTALYFPNAIRR
ncbi:VWA domain-containing protein [Hydrogenophaga sp. XSHU_21]